MKEEPERPDAELGDEDYIEGQVPSHRVRVAAPWLGGEPNSY